MMLFKFFLTMFYSNKNILVFNYTFCILSKRIDESFSLTNKLIPPKLLMLTKKYIPPKLIQMP